ncbi:Hypothetical predicted protein, partial [Podarcis lilfordi]
MIVVNSLPHVDIFAKQPMLHAAVLFRRTRDPKNDRRAPFQYFAYNRAIHIFANALLLLTRQYDAPFCRTPKLSKSRRNANEEITKKCNKRHYRKKQSL